MLPNANEKARKLGRRGHGVDRAPVDRALRHSIDFGRVRLLRESEAVLCLDGLQPLGPYPAPVPDKMTPMVRWL